MRRNQPPSTTSACNTSVESPCEAQLVFCTETHLKLVSKIPNSVLVPDFRTGTCKNNQEGMRKSPGFLEKWRSLTAAVKRCFESYVCRWQSVSESAMPPHLHSRHLWLLYGHFRCRLCARVAHSQCVERLSRCQSTSSSTTGGAPPKVANPQGHPSCKLPLTYGHHLASLFDCCLRAARCTHLVQ